MEKYIYKMKKTREKIQKKCKSFYVTIKSPNNSDYGSGNKEREN